MEQKTVLLTLKSKQVIENPDLTREDMVNAFEDGDWESDTEEFLDEWEDDEYYDDEEFEEDFADEEDDGTAVRYPKKLTQELQARFDKLMDVIFGMEDVNEEDEEYYVMTTEAVMCRYPGEDGGEIIDITYDENPTMDDTKTTLRLNSAHPESLVIMRNGGLVNTLICEKGVRHVSYYTPSGLPLPFPIQMTVYTRYFNGGITFEDGGAIALDYMTAMHGLDKQRTDMKLTVVPR